MNFLKFLWEDLKSDVLFVKDVLTGKKKIKLDMKKFDFNLKESWLFFLILILAFCVGFFFASQYYQNECNMFIIENYLSDDYDLIGGNMLVKKQSINLSEEVSVFPIVPN